MELGIKDRAMTTSESSAYKDNHVQICTSCPPYKITQFDNFQRSYLLVLKSFFTFASAV